MANNSGTGTDNSESYILPCVSETHQLFRNEILICEMDYLDKRSGRPRRRPCLIRPPPPDALIARQGVPRSTYVNAHARGRLRPPLGPRWGDRDQWRRPRPAQPCGQPRHAPCVSATAVLRECSATPRGVCALGGVVATRPWAWVPQLLIPRPAQPNARANTRLLFSLFLLLFLGEKVSRSAGASVPGWDSPQPRPGPLADNPPVVGSTPKRDVARQPHPDAQWGTTVAKHQPPLSTPVESTRPYGGTYPWHGEHPKHPRRST
jgi:hypothetical protein